jgi:hypothetical protein
MTYFRTENNLENLCDSCQWHVAECCGVDLEYGDGEGLDNITGCDQYSGSEYEPISQNDK